MIMVHANIFSEQTRPIYIIYSICSYFAFRVQLLFACNHLFKVFFTATPGADDAICSMP